MRDIHVFKFGGASVKDAESIRNVCSIIEEFKHLKLVIIVSAMGKSTNALEQIVEYSLSDKDQALTSLKHMQNDHVTVLQNLISGDQFEKAEKQLDVLFKVVEEFISTNVSSDYDFVYDQIVSLGELASTHIISHYLKSCGRNTHWLDARQCVKTDGTFREGRVDWEITENLINQAVFPLIKDNKIVVSQGFIASSKNGSSTTLGREGSDYSAAIFSYCLHAQEMSIWKDVPGILTADPRLFTNVQKIDHLSYREATEMTYYGAKVIHPKTIKPLQNKNIPLHVKAFENPKGIGTIISSEVSANYPPVIVIEKNQIMLHISTRDFSFVAEHHLADLFDVFSEYRFKVNLMRNTAISFSVCLTNKPRSLDKLINRLEHNYNVSLEKNLELITIRHYTQLLIDDMKSGKIVLFEERIPNTIQLVVKDIPRMKRIDS